MNEVKELYLNFLVNKFSDYIDELEENEYDTFDYWQIVYDDCLFDEFFENNSIQDTTDIEDLTEYINKKIQDHTFAAEIGDCDIPLSMSLDSILIRLMESDIFDELGYKVKEKYCL